jgi:hypothetical protein
MLNGCRHLILFFSKKFTAIPYYRGVVAEPNDLSASKLFFPDRQVTVFFSVLSLLSTFCA